MIEDLVEMQQRRHDFLCKLDDLSFFPQLAPYLDALVEDPRIGAILQDLLLDAQKVHEDYNAQEKETVRQLVELRNVLAKVAPDLDDSRQKFDLNDVAEEQAYGASLARFDEFASRPLNIQFPIRADSREDGSTTCFLLEILLAKVKDSPLKDLARQVANVRRHHERNFQTFLVRARTSAGFSALRLVRARDELLPTAIRIDQGADRWETLLRFMPEMFGTGSFVRRALFLAQVAKEDEEEVAAQRRRLQSEAQRLHEEVVQRLYRRRSYRVLIERFQFRCESYDRERLRKLTLKKGRRELPLNAEAARFLFDNGLAPLIAPESGGLRPDILDSRVWSFYVESKQYGEKGGRETIRRGAYQIWDTAGTLKVRGLREVFWLVFRRAGPRYVLPAELRADGIVVFPVHIDIAPLPKVGSGQKKKPIEIPPEELLPERSSKRRSKRRSHARSRKKAKGK